jgi:hypothetical protein
MQAELKTVDGIKTISWSQLVMDWDAEHLDIDQLAASTIGPVIFRELFGQDEAAVIITKRSHRSMSVDGTVHQYIVTFNPHFRE